MKQKTDVLGDGRLIFLLGGLAAFGPLAIDLYLPALPAIAAGLSGTMQQVQLSVTVFLAGFGVGMLFYGPISDQYGRRVVLLSGVALFVVASFACMVAQDISQLLIARFFQAVGGGAGSVLARAVLRDMFAPSEAIRKLSLMAMVTSVAPLLAPMLGSIILSVFSWRGTFAAMLLWGGVACWVVWKWLPETLPPEQRQQTNLVGVFSAYWKMLTDLPAVCLLITGGMSFAALFAYITGSPYFFIELKGFTPMQYSFIFAANALGILLSNYLNSRLIKHAQPVTILRSACLIGFIAAIGFVGSVAFGVHSPFWAMGLLFLIIGMTGLLGANCVGLLMVRFDTNAGAAAALFGATQFGLGMLASASVSYFHGAAGYGLAGVIVFVTGASLIAATVYNRVRE